MLAIFRSQLAKAALPFALLSLGVGCGADYADESGGQAEAAINGGVAVTSTASPYASVIYFATSTNELCGATKIRQSSTRDTYLTAAHCVPGPGIGPGWFIRMGNGFD